MSRKTVKESGYDKTIQIFEVPLAEEEPYDEITASDSKYKNARKGSTRVLASQEEMKSTAWLGVPL